MAATVETPIFNPQAHIHTERLANGLSCLVVDDALLHPERLRQFAIDQRHAFQAVDFNAYPGIYLPAPRETLAALEGFFQQHVRRLFDARRILHMHCRLSMVTTPPQTLRPNQWICHRDSDGLNAYQSVQASVLYLFKDESLGGTSFYEQIGSAEETAQLFRDADKFSAADFAQKYSIEPGYIHQSNRYFKHIGSIAPKWNRIIFYDGSILHSGHIPAPEKLSADPRIGRLTLNGFFTSRRNLV